MLSIPAVRRETKILHKFCYSYGSSAKPVLPCKIGMNESWEFYVKHLGQKSVEACKWSHYSELSFVQVVACPIAQSGHNHDKDSLPEGRNRFHYCPPVLCSINRILAFIWNYSKQTQFCAYLCNETLLPNFLRSLIRVISRTYFQ